MLRQESDQHQREIIEELARDLGEAATSKERKIGDLYNRTNGPLRNFDAFYEAFGVVEGDGMYMAPEERVKIW